MSGIAEWALGTFVRVHDAVYQRTDGWIGHRIPGAPNSLLLHTIGAKTGLPRTHSLSYARDGYLVVASTRGPGLSAAVADRQHQQRQSLRWISGPH